MRAAVANAARDVCRDVRGHPDAAHRNCAGPLLAATRGIMIPFLIMSCYYYYCYYYCYYYYYY